MEIIVGLLFVCYYVFCVFAMATFISETRQDMKWYQVIIALFITIFLSLLSIPLIMGIKIGLWLSEY